MAVNVKVITNSKENPMGKKKKKIIICSNQRWEVMSLRVEVKKKYLGL